MAAKKICFIQYTMNGGGAEKVLTTLLNNLDYSKYQVTLVLIYKEGVYLNKVNRNVEVKSIYNPNRFNNRILRSVYYRIIMFLYYKYPKLLYRFIVGNQNDIEIAFLEGETTRFLSKSTNKHSQKISWVHSDLEKHRTTSEKEELKTYNKMNKIVCVSNDAKIKFDNLYPELKSKTIVIYNLLDSNEIRENSEKQLTNIKDNRLSIISIGRLTHPKGYDILLKAHNELINEGLIYNLIILGEGPQRGELEKYIEENKLKDSVELLGFRENPYPYIKQSDLVIVSSRYEGFSLVLAESMILGKPIISTKCTGPIELLNNGEYGVLVECDNYLQLKDKMKEMIINENIRLKYSNLSKNRANIFDKEKVIREIEKIIG